MSLIARQPWVWGQVLTKAGWHGQLSKQMLTPVVVESCSSELQAPTTMGQAGQAAWALGPKFKPGAAGAGLGPGEVKL